MRLLFSFQKYGGLYFWAILITTWALCIRAVTFLIKFVTGHQGLAVMIFYEIGWIGMVSGFSVVLYSRLRILIQNRRILQIMLAVIIINGICLHTATVVVILGINTRPTWIAPSLVLERVHIVVFAVQEAVLSCMCTKAAWDQLQAPLRPSNNTKLIMRMIIAIQVLVISIDIVVVVFDMEEYYSIKSLIYAFTYAIKLEFEFLALNQLVAISRLGRNDIVSIPLDSELRATPRRVAPTLTMGEAEDMDGRMSAQCCFCFPCALQMNIRHLDKKSTTLMI